MLILDENVHCVWMPHRISALRRKLTIHYKKNYSLFLAYLKPESLTFKIFTRVFYFNCLKIVMGWDVLGDGRWYSGYCGILGRCSSSPFDESPSSFMLGDDHNVLRPLSQQEDDFSLWCFIKLWGLMIRNIFKGRILIETF